jgi:flavin-dependent dehydrogenase
VSQLVRILGGGPAGTSAALGALNNGASVEIVERSRYPRHKVCGEFLSPEIAPVLEALGVYGSFAALRPQRVTRMSLVFRSCAKTAVLPEPAYGLSRFTLDHLLWSQAVARGAVPVAGGKPDIVTTGRSATGEVRGARLFGFKAHFEGPVHDAVELYFLDRAYIGISCVENGCTNVCGLAHESQLNAHGFEPDSLLSHGGEALRERIRPLQRTMKWLFTGPLTYGQSWNRRDVYMAGDALSFVDPFTGSGLFAATLTGSLAGECAARGVSVPKYLKACRSAIRRPFLFSSMLRSMAGTSWAERLLPWVPARVLFEVTRPRLLTS